MSSGSVEEFNNHSGKIAQRFLQTAIVVDDKAYITQNQDDVPKDMVVEPGRNTRISHRAVEAPIPQKADLDATPLIGSFSKLGIICGVVGPTNATMDTMKKADIVILDWYLQDHEPIRALSLLGDLLAENAGQKSLRLVAIYTGEAKLREIQSQIFEKLNKDGLEPKNNKIEMEISYRHGRVVLYAKSDVNLASDLKDRSVMEKDLPRRLVDDFASMTSGLLPGIALTSLTAVREGAHKVLDRFSLELDPAFLAHRACLKEPEDAEHQIVYLVAEELRGLMDNAVVENSPAGVAAVEGWIQQKIGENDGFTFGDLELDVEATITLANKGLKACNQLNENAYKVLSAGFSGNNGINLDERLAWIMSYRTVHNEPSPMLWQGTIVTPSNPGCYEYLICIRPRCDCVRLDDKTTFSFLPLITPKSNLVQIIVRDDDSYKIRGVQIDPSGWVLHDFMPRTNSRVVTAEKQENGEDYEFIDTNRNRYRWRGELKTEYVQRIVQNFVTKLIRPAVDESEWLRRETKI